MSTKQTLKNEMDMLDLINKIQTQLSALDRKVDTLISRSMPETKPAPKPPVNNHQRTMHTGICADCKKECTIPFKPSGDRPIYCQDCFSRRKVIKMSGMSVPAPVALPVAAPKPEAKKKIVKAKKTVAKKKPVSKKKR